MNTNEALLEAIKSLVVSKEEPKESSELELELDKNFLAIWCGRMTPSGYAFVSKDQKREYKNKGAALNYCYEYKIKYPEKWCCVVKNDCNGKTCYILDRNNLPMMAYDVREFAETFKKES